MKNVAIITPIVLQNEQMLNIYLSNLSTYKQVVKTKIYLICNRINFDLNILSKKIKDVTLIDFEIFCDKERSVAGAWNFGILKAKQEGFNIFHILAADIALHPSAHNILLNKIENCDICSSIDFKNSYGKIDDEYGVSDFSSVFFKSETFDKFGYFDREYKPAYFEDNDYMIRLYKNRGISIGAKSAIHYHYGSATINVDAEMSHHVKHWFSSNRSRFIKKWGQDTNKDINGYFYTPFNSGKFLGWYPEMDKSNYLLDGGMHE